MNLVTVVVLLNWFLLSALVLTAPTSQLPGLQRAVEQARMVLDKVLEGVRASYAATVTVPGWSLSPPSPSTELETKRGELGIPSAPVLNPRWDDTCVSRMLSGIQLHQNLLLVLSGHVTGLSNLNSDIRDLKLRVDKIKEADHLSGTGGSDQVSGSDLAARLDGDYDVQVAVHLTLTQLQSFCHDMSRSLRKKESDLKAPSSGT